jgi:hypothetical protein
VVYQTIGENPCGQLAGRGVHETGVRAPGEFDASPPRTCLDDVLGYLVIRRFHEHASSRNYFFVCCQGPLVH